MRLSRNKLRLAVVGGCVLTILTALGLMRIPSGLAGNGFLSFGHERITFKPRNRMDTSGFGVITRNLVPWPPSATLQDIAQRWMEPGLARVKELDRVLAASGSARTPQMPALIEKALCLGYEGQPEAAYNVLREAREIAESRPEWSARVLYSVIYLQGVFALRRGETDNCIMCRGESSCILPISRAAVHTNKTGSRLACKHFTEYLARFPDDLEVRWLLNLAHMTLGEYPEHVDPRYRVSLERFEKSEFNIGQFRDIGASAGVNRFNQAGGAIMEDFDNDGLLDLAVTTIDHTMSMCLYQNAGDGTFIDQTDTARVGDQLGGLYCVQADYNNDGLIDIFIPRGAWMVYPIRPTLLRNDGNWKFTDVTLEAGLTDPLNSNSACWQDYDNDGWVDLFVCCEQQSNRLYRNLGNGTFEEVTYRAGLQSDGPSVCKGATWLDYDNDGHSDLFITHLIGKAQMFRNKGNGEFTELTAPLGIDGPTDGFSCWSWDFDNDGWLDIFATSYDHTLGDVVKGLLGESHACQSNRLFRNREGAGFEDVTKSAGLDQAFATMGSNFGDVDNDGFLDFYLGTGDPSFESLMPQRLFKNVAGKRFSEITGSTRTGHLQKGHAVAFGDWDRDGDNDIFIELGGTVNGDKYHNVLFDNPGQGNHWLSVKLVGKKTNRAAIGARVKVVTAGPHSRTIARHISSGSSFGANPLEQSIGLGNADRVARLEVFWPTSGTTQVFTDIAVNQSIEVVEFADTYEVRALPPVRREP